MKSEIKRWVNTLTPLELLIYDIDKNEINRWLNELENEKLPTSLQRRINESFKETLSSKGKTK